MRALIAALVLCIVSACSGAPVTTHAVTAVQAVHPQTFHEMNFDRVRKIQCTHDNYDMVENGTGWIIARNTVVTAAHVIDQYCIDAATRLPAIPYYVDWDNDLALVYINTGPVTDTIPYSCSGYKKGERYSSIGFAGGLRLRETRLIGTGAFTGNGATMQLDKTTTVPSVHFAMLNGYIYHGMSGGPIIDEEGNAVGINSTTDGKDGGTSRELRDTILCGKPRRNRSDLHDPPFTKLIRGARFE